MKKRNYIGLACSYHDPAICIVNSRGEVVFAEAAERYLQDKRAMNCAPDHPTRIASLLEEYIEPGAELVLAKSWSAKYARRCRRVSWRLGWRQWFRDWLRKDDSDIPRPLDLFRSVAESMGNSVNHAGWNLRSQLVRDYIYGKAHHKQRARSGVSLADLGRVHEVAFDHHLTHAAAGSFSSGFSQASVAIIDASGEGRATAFYRYDQGRLTEIEGSRSPGTNIGFFYDMLCHVCGFDTVKGEQWKVMGLAAYGKRDEEMYTFFRSLLRIDGLRISHGRDREQWLPQTLALAKERDRADVAHTGQLVVEEWVIELLNNLYEQCPNERLVLGGGCALNSSCNGKILEHTPFQEMHVFCAPADDGNAVGAALLAYYQDHPGAPVAERRMLPYLGSRLSSKSLSRLEKFGRGLPLVRGSESQLCRHAAQLLADGKIIGWAQGRAEFGPRALGNRSILADPRRPEIKDELNSRVKFREEFRPFAPAVLHEFGPDYFENYQESPYMERTLRFRPEVVDQVPGVVHADGTGRLQTVKEEWNKRFYWLLREFHDLTGVPILLNTSFNVMGKPIIHSVEDAVAVFMTAGLDALVLEDMILEKHPE